MINGTVIGTCAAISATIADVSTSAAPTLTEVEPSIEATADTNIAIPKKPILNILLPAIFSTCLDKILFLFFALFVLLYLLPIFQFKKNSGTEVATAIKNPANAVPNHMAPCTCEEVSNVLDAAIIPSAARTIWIATNLPAVFLPNILIFIFFPSPSASSSSSRPFSFTPDLEDCFILIKLLITGSPTPTKAIPNDTIATVTGLANPANNTAAKTIVANRLNAEVTVLLLVNGNSAFPPVALSALNIPIPKIKGLRISLRRILKTPKEPLPVRNASVVAVPSPAEVRAALNDEAASSAPFPNLLAFSTSSSSLFEKKLVHLYPKYQVNPAIATAETLNVVDSPATIAGVENVCSMFKTLNAGPIIGKNTTNAIPRPIIESSLITNLLSKGIPPSDEK